jgi:RNA polymerase sigma factor (sigma-70 family)
LRLQLSTLTSHSDQYLINGLATNNSAIINEVYKKYTPKMYNWVKQHGGDLENAQDVFQEALIDIYRKVQDGNFVLTCPFDAFLFVVVRNKWFSYLKNNKLKVVTNSEDALYNITSAVTADTEKIMQYENQYILLQQKLDDLQEGCKELLKFSWSGLCMEDVAQKLQVTYAYARKKKSLCMAKLMESIKESSEYINLSFTV